jgi:hypothetical protein
MNEKSVVKHDIEKVVETAEEKETITYTRRKRARQEN